jgi:hypothetical protein
MPSFLLLLLLLLTPLHSGFINRTISPLLLTSQMSTLYGAHLELRISLLSTLKQLETLG